MQALAPEDPRSIGQYSLLGRLGEGGMGRVYLGRSGGGRTVALKVVQRELAQLPEFRWRFAREVASARRVGSEWTAAVLDADTEAAVPWVATQYILGPSLHEVVAESYGALPELSVRVLANRLALALSAVHGVGLIHRDLKPSNVLVTVDGPRVIDFGIARALDALDTVAGDVAQTRTGMVIGSPGFMSPEQARGLELTAASDVFCLGSVLVYAATARQPFGASGSGSGGLHAQLFRVAEDEPDLDGVPESLLTLVRACLQKDPTLRPSPQEVADRTAGLTAGPWLPGEVLEQLGRRAAELLDYDPALTINRRPTPTVKDIPAAGTIRGTAASGQTTPPLPLAPPMMPAQPPAVAGRGRNRTTVVGVAAVALIAVGAGLLALKLWDDSKSGAGQGGTTAVPRQFQGKWEGKLTKQGETSGEHVHLEIKGAGTRAAKVSILGKTRLCVTGRVVERADYDESSGERTLTLSKGSAGSATPKSESAKCSKQTESELKFSPTPNDRLVWIVDGYEIQLTRQENSSLDRYQATSVWYPDTDAQEPGTLELIQVAGVSVEQNTITIIDGMGPNPSCGYEAKVFSVKDDLLTTPPQLDARTAGLNRDCPRSRSPLRLTLLDDQRMEYRSLDSADTGSLTSTPP
ncbi:serine/threonine-protein kinase [Streptomyces sp. NPDC050423]|uniref:serine/threonine-protein kinase n=1 Tax=Streptomyces sp. NPDC050423 TaxID=3155402 RepID=UPI00343FBBE2